MSERHIVGILTSQAVMNESYLVENPKDRFFRATAHFMFLSQVAVCVIKTCHNEAYKSANSPKCNLIDSTR